MAILDRFPGVEAASGGLGENDGSCLNDGFDPDGGAGREDPKVVCLRPDWISWSAADPNGRTLSWAFLKPSKVVWMPPKI